MAGIPDDIVKWVKENIIHGGPLDVAAWAEEWGREEGITGIATEGKRAGIDDELDAFRHAFVSAYKLREANKLPPEQPNLKIED